MAMEGPFARYLEDHYSAAPVEREPLTDECDVLVVGAGFPGLLLWYKLLEGRLRRHPVLRAGRRRRRHLVLEPLSGHRLRRRVLLPTCRCWMRPATSRSRSSRRASRSSSTASGSPRGSASTTTASSTPRSTGTEWDEDTQRWTVPTDRGDAMRARFVILANGILTTPAAGPHPRHGEVPGSRSTPPAGTTTSTSTGKRIGIIGTGATAVQAIPELAKVAGHLYVFQRTPSTIDVRDQRSTTARADRALEAAAGVGARPPRPLRRDPRSAAAPSRTTTTWPAGRRCQERPRPMPGRGSAGRSGSKKQLDDGLPDHAADP